MGKNPFLLTIIWLCLLSVTACTWHTEEVVYTDIDPAPVTNLMYIGIYQESDTVDVTDYTSFIVVADIDNPTDHYFQFRAIIDGDTTAIGINTYSLIIDPSRYSPGQYVKVRLLAVGPTGTGSIADQIGLEKTGYYRDLYFHIATYRAESEILEVANVNGFKTVKWKKFDKANFERYVVMVRKSFRTSSFEFTHPDDTVWVDSLYMLGDFKVEVIVEASFGAHNRDWDTYEDDYFPGAIQYQSIGRSDVQISWHKPFYYGPLKGYSVVGIDTTIEVNHVDDTVAMLKNHPFGASFPVRLNYWNSEGPQYLFKGVHTAQTAPEWRWMEHFPRSGRTVGINNTEVYAMNIPPNGLQINRTSFATSDGIDFYWDNYGKVSYGNYTTGQISEFFDFSPVLPDKRIHYATPAISHDGTTLAVNVRYSNREETLYSTIIYLVDVASGEILSEKGPMYYFVEDVAFSADDQFLVYGQKNEIHFVNIEGNSFGTEFTTPKYYGKRVFPLSDPGKVYIMNEMSATEFVVDLSTHEVSSRRFPVDYRSEDVVYDPTDDSFMYVGNNSVSMADRITGVVFDSLPIYLYHSRYYKCHDTLYSGDGYKLYLGE